MKTTVEMQGKGANVVVRHFNEKHQLVGYCDKNYAFTCERTESGDMINYQNTYGEKLEKATY